MTGASAGGEFTYYLTKKNPWLARAVIPIYGLPLVDMLKVPKDLSTVPIMQLHDRSDLTEPWQGGNADDGWIFESVTTTLAMWARNHSCKSSRKLKGVNTPFDGGNANMVCQEHKQC